jgi:hypothetical protein
MNTNGTRRPHASDGAICWPTPRDWVSRKLSVAQKRTTLTPACHRCTLAEGAGNYVDFHTIHERLFGQADALWMGERTAGSGDQFSVRDCPKITMASHHLENLIIQHGHSPNRKTSKQT